MAAFDATAFDSSAFDGNPSDSGTGLDASTITASHVGADSGTGSDASHGFAINPVHIEGVDWYAPLGITQSVRVMWFD